MFEFLGSIFNAILYYPLFNLLITVYNFLPWHDFGLAIIVVTVVIKVALHPATVKALHSQRAMARLQPKLQQIQKEYKNDKEKQAKETMELYRKESINPFVGLLLMLVQLPILIALYQVFWNGLDTSNITGLYSFVANPGQVNLLFLGILDLSKPAWLLAVVAAGVQFYQTKMLIPQKDKNNPSPNDIATNMQNQMVYFFPVITFIFLLKLPAAVGLYWIAIGIVSIVQQYIILRDPNV